MSAILAEGQGPGSTQSAKTMSFAAMIDIPAATFKWFADPGGDAIGLQEGEKVGLQAGHMVSAVFVRICC
jgi:hypothetical protein